MLGAITCLGAAPPPAGVVEHSLSAVERSLSAVDDALSSALERREPKCYPFLEGISAGSLFTDQVEGKTGVLHSLVRQLKGDTNGGKKWKCFKAYAATEGQVPEMVAFLEALAELQLNPNALQADHEHIYNTFFKKNAYEQAPKLLNVPDLLQAEPRCFSSQNCDQNTWDERAAKVVNDFSNGLNQDLKKILNCDCKSKVAQFLKAHPNVKKGWQIAKVVDQTGLLALTTWAYENTVKAKQWRWKQCKDTDPKFCDHAALSGFKSEQKKLAKTLADDCKSFSMKCTNEQLRNSYH